MPDSDRNDACAGEGLAWTITASSTCGKWKFRDVREEGIVAAQAKVEVFHESALGGDKSRQRMMIAAPFAPMAGHPQ